jgi:hypothetical protein
MNDKDLRDCFAMMRSITGVSAEECYKFADEMLEARDKDDEKELGIAAFKPKKRIIKKDNGGRSI